MSTGNVVTTEDWRKVHDPHRTPGFDHARVDAGHPSGRMIHLCCACGARHATTNELADREAARQACEHKDFKAQVNVHRFEDTGTFLAEVSVQCADCALPFSFVGLPLAISTTKGCVNIDGTQVNLPMEPGPKPIPAFGSIPVEMPLRSES